MTHRERIQAALKRQSPDRVPVDLGSTLASTLTIGAHERLRAHLGIPAEKPAEVFSKRSCTVRPDEEILERFGVDTRPVLLGMPDERPDRNVAPNAFIDEWEVTWTQPEGGHFINTDGPFRHHEEPTIQDLDNHSWPDPADPGRYRGLRERARQLHEETDYAVVLGLGVGPVHQAQFMRGYAEWLEDLILNPAFAEGLLEHVTDVWIDVVTRAMREAGGHVDLVMFGDDVGTQKSPLMRPELYRKVIKPQHKRMIDAVKPFAKPVLYHSCGSVHALIPDLIDVGVDILNPIQVSAKHMDTATLKREFGGDLIFWGAIDNQGVLPRGTPQDVEAEVKRRIGDLGGGGGGYVVAPAHNIQQDVPPENIVTLYETALRYG